jgi:hypothetical protein
VLRARFEHLTTREHNRLAGMQLVLRARPRCCGGFTPWWCAASRGIPRWPLGGDPRRVVAAHAAGADTAEGQGAGADVDQAGVIDVPPDDVCCSKNRRVRGELLNT